MKFGTIVRYTKLNMLRLGHTDHFQIDHFACFTDHSSKNIFFKHPLLYTIGKAKMRCYRT